METLKKRIIIFQLFILFFFNNHLFAQSPVVTSNPTSAAICSGNNVIFTAEASGTPTPTIQWQFSSNSGSSWSNISGATNTTYTFTPSSGYNNYQYHAVFTNSFGSITSSAALLNVTNPISLICEVSSDSIHWGTPVGCDTTICEGMKLLLSMNPNNLPFPLSTWTGPNGFSVTSTNTNNDVVVTNSVTPANAGVYTMTYVQNGCVSTKSITIHTASVPVVGAITGNSSVCVGSTIQLSDTSLGGVWSSSNINKATVNSSGIVTGVASGTVTISYTVTNGNGCSTTQTYQITVVAPVSFTCEGSINNQNYTSLPNCTMTVCEGNHLWLSVNPNGLVPTTNWTGPNGYNSNSINANNDVLISNSMTQSMAGIYTVTYNSGVCVSTRNITVIVNAISVVGAITGSSSVCVGSSIQLSDTSQGGVWTSSNNNYATVNSLGVVTGIAGGNVTISYTVTNANGCPTTQTMVVTVIAPVSFTCEGSINNQNYTSLPNCTMTVCEGNHLWLSVNPNGLVPTTNWTGPNGYNSNSINANNDVLISNSMTQSMAGIYTVTYNSGVCVSTRNITVIVNSLPVLDTIVPSAKACVGKVITLTNTTSGGTWTSSNNSIASIASNGNLTSLTVGNTTITYTVTNASGCTSSITKQITVYSSPSTPSVTGSSTLCPGSNITLSGSPSGGAWSSNNTSLMTVNSSGVATALSSGTDTISYAITSANGCSTSGIKAVNILSTSTSTTNISVCPSALPYHWNGSNYNTSGNYTYTTSNSHGCDSVATLILSVDAPLIAACSNTSASGYGATDASVGVLASGGTSGYTYSWSNGATSSSVTGLSTGSFSVTVTDAHGCTAACATTLNNFTQANWDATSTNENTQVSGSVSGNDIQSADGGNVWSLVTNPAHGSVIVTANGGYSYTPDSYYYGADNFVYQLCDANGDCDTAVVYLTVVGAPVTPAVSINASSTTICAGASVTFTATPTNGGSTPSYQWKKNGNNVGSNAASYVDAGLVNGDVVTVVLTSSHPNASPTTATSNSVTMTVNNIAAQPSSFTQSLDTLYWGQNPVTFAVSNVAGVTYNWNYSGNNVSINGSGNSISLTPAQNATSGTLSVTATNGCGTSAARTLDITIVQTITWTAGGGNSNWNDTANWDAGVVPTDSNNVVIPANPVIPPAIPNTVSVKDLTVAAGNTLQIPSGDILSVSGHFINNGTITGGTLKLNGASAQTIAGKGTVEHFELNNSNGATINLGDTLYISGDYLPTAGTLNTNGALVLLSDALHGTASILAPQGTCGNYINGNVVVNKYVHGGRRAFRFLAHPFSTSIGLDQLTDDFDITGQGGSTNGFTTTNTNNASAFWYNTLTGNGSSVDDNTGWIAYTNTNGLNENVWNPLQGARMYIRGEKGQGLGCAACTPNPVTFDMTGPVNMCDVNVTLQTNANMGYNFVGNPYPANIDMSLLNLGSSVGANFSVWDPNQGVYGAYVTQPFAFSYILPAYSSFIVTNAANTNNTITFTEAAKVNAAATGDLFKTTNASSFGANSLQLKITSNNDSVNWDRLLVFFDNNATTAKDTKDAKKLNNISLDFYSKTTDSNKLAVDFRPLSIGDVIQLGLRADSQMSYNLKVADLDAPTGMVLYLKDKFLNTKQAMSQGMNYAFSVNSNPLSQGDNRFEIVAGNTTGIDNIASNGIEISLMPNPASEKVTIALGGVKGNSHISISNLMGQVVFSTDVINNNSITVPLNDLSAGIYLVNVTNGEHTSTTKLIKE